MSNDLLCRICPRQCGANRVISLGFCGVGHTLKVARAAPHFGEEPCISGKNGSGAVFFSGCNLGCVYCQNESISRGKLGKEISVDELKNIYTSLISQGVHNINLVTPCHFRDAVAESLSDPLPVPVICNTGGYDSIETVAAFEGKVDVYLPDYKYSNDDVAKKYSGASNYPKVALEAIRAMIDSVKPLEFDENGMIKSGVIIRHLMLPNELENTLGCIEAVAELPKNKVMLSLMSQYTPVCGSDKYENLGRRITEEEYRLAMDYVHLCGIKRGYFQSPESAIKTHIPAFDLTGV